MKALMLTAALSLVVPCAALAQATVIMTPAPSPSTVLQPACIITSPAVIEGQVHVLTPVVPVRLEPVPSNYAGMFTSLDPHDYMWPYGI